MSADTKENENGYNTWSEFYDSYPNPTVAMDELNFPNVYAPVRQQNVLEIGCGTGRHTIRLIAAENQVTGIDISEGMLAQLRVKVKSPHLHLIKGDFLSTSIPNSPFDSVIASLVLEHIPDLACFFKATRKVLKTDGYVYISEIHPARTDSGIFAHFKKPDGSEVHLKSRPHTSAEISEAAIKEGFIVKDTMSVDANQDLANLNSKWTKHIGRPMVQIWVLQKSE